MSNIFLFFQFNLPCPSSFPHATYIIGIYTHTHIYTHTLDYDFSCNALICYTTTTIIALFGMGHHHQKKQETNERSKANLRMILYHYDGSLRLPTTNQRVILSNIPYHIVIFINYNRFTPLWQKVFFYIFDL